MPHSNLSFTWCVILLLFPNATHVTNLHWPRLFNFCVTLILSNSYFHLSLFPPLFRSKVQYKWMFLLFLMSVRAFNIWVQITQKPKCLKKNGLHIVNLYEKQYHLPNYKTQVFTSNFCLFENLKPFFDRVFNASQLPFRSFIIFLFYLIFQNCSGDNEEESGLQFQSHDNNCKLDLCNLESYA